MGGFDIFFSKYDSLQSWSKPKNIGYPINTKNDDVAFSVSTDGTRIYFASNKLGNKNNWNIYSVQTPENAKPEQVLLVKGKVKGEDGDTIAEVRVIAKSINTKKETEGFVNQNTGDYAITVPVKKDEKFILTAKKKGYFFKSIFIDPNNKEYVPPTRKDFNTKKITKNVAIRLNNVNFKFDSYLLNDTSIICLDYLAQFLKQNKSKKITIYGHTDNVGSLLHNMELSQKRAESVRNYLIKKGVEAKNITAKGFGKSKPLTTNKTEKGRALNRRVEFVINK